MKRYVSAHLKDMNRKKVYDLISSVGEISRAEISRRTGISSPTVLRIVDFFLKNNFVVELGEGDSSVGRKPQILKFNPEAAFSIGVEFEGDFLKVGIVDLLGNVKYSKSLRVNPVFDEIINNKLYGLIKDIIVESKVPEDKVLGVGIGIPGVTDTLSYTINVAPLVGIYDIKNCKDMIDKLSKKLELPIIIDNDANTAAWGEFVYRKLDSKTDLIYVSLGTGLGAGLVLDGKIRRGVNYSAGEIGYMVFDKDYKASKSEPGWLEKLINFNTLAKKWSFFQEIQNSTDSTESLNINKYELNEMVEYVATNLALSIANIVAVLDVSLVVLGGVTVKALGNRLIDRVGSYLSKMCLIDVKCIPQECEEPGVVGAASIVTNSRLRDILEG